MAGTENTGWRRVGMCLLSITATLGPAGCAARGAADIPSRAQPAAIVHTAAGPVRGTVATDHRSFAGIPYAAPPVGALRWRSPQPVPHWTQPRPATAAGDPCPQRGVELGAASHSEDCLHLNVTTPRHTSGRRLPVLVYLHGGSFEDGAGSLYGGAPLAAGGDLVVVTVNYRLGVFGFLAHPALNADAPLGSGNFGLEDQLAALRWVRRNAAAFGGDPGNVTLVGESAGGISVCAHLASPASAGLFHRAIVHSAPCARTHSDTETHLPRARVLAERQGADVVARLPGPAGAPTAARLRDPALTVDALLDAADGHPGFGPVLGAPLLPTDPAHALATGRLHRVPLLHGITHDEHRLHVWGMEMARYGGRPTPDADYPAHLAAAFGNRADRVLARYPRRAYGSASEALATALTDARWARPALDGSVLAARQLPTYTYEFAETTNPWFRGTPVPAYPMGAFHTAELPYLFAMEHFEPLNATQRQLADRMIGYWARFARTGDPNGGGAPGWPAFTGTRPYVQSLTSARVGPVDFRRDHRHAFWASLDR